MIGPRHPSVQRLRQLSRRRRARTEEGAFVIDGPTLLADALAGGITVTEVFADASADTSVLESAAASGAIVHRVREGLLAQVTGTVTPQSVASVADRFDVDLLAATGDLSSEDDPLVVVLVGVNDPGNLGTLLRSACAVGAKLVLCCDETVDPYNPKAVRASAGALFGLQVVREAEGKRAVEALQARRLSCVGTTVRGGVAYDGADLTGPVAVVLGSEAHGLPARLEQQVDELVSIPMVGPAESLNVAMAGTVVCFEALRQRQHLTRSGSTHIAKK